MNIDEKIDRQKEICEDIFIKRPSYIGVVLTVVTVLGLFASAVAFGLSSAQRTTKIETQLPELNEKLNECKSRLDKIDVMNSKLDTLINRIK
jgi:mevalonate kinase